MFGPKQISIGLFSPVFRHLKDDMETAAAFTLSTSDAVLHLECGTPQDSRQWLRAFHELLTRTYRRSQELLEQTQKQPRAPFPKPEKAPPQIPTEPPPVMADREASLPGEEEGHRAARE